MEKNFLERIEELDKKGLITQEEYSIYNPLNYPIGYDKKMLFKEINESIEYLVKKVNKK